MIVNWLPVLVVAFLGREALAENWIDIGGSGGGVVHVDISAAVGSSVSIYQVNPGVAEGANWAGEANNPITLIGAENNARIGQGAIYDDNWMSVGVVGGNFVTLQQDSSGAAGSGHEARIFQTSDGNEAKLVQSGVFGMSAHVTQSGASPSILDALQRGSTAYMLTVNQTGAGGHMASVATTSDYMGGSVALTQSGSDNSAVIDGMSGGAATINQSGSDGMVVLSNQSSGMLTINQSGVTPYLSVAGYGVGDSSGQPMVITQEGGSLLVFDPEPPPSGPAYSATPPGGG